MKTAFYIRMMITGIGCLVSLAIHAQDADSSRKTMEFPVVVQFQSVCCGVPADSLLRCFIKSFKKKNKLKKITAQRIGPMGKEGEYWLAFPLDELNQSQTVLFVSKIKKVAEKMKEPGMTAIEEKLIIDPAALPGRSSITKIVF